MKTARSTPPSHGSPHQFRPPKSNTPLASPRMLAHSAGQPYAPRQSPKHSPGAAVLPRQSPGTAQESKSTSSPSYFGLIVEPSAELRESGAVPRENWSPPSSSVKSFATAIPKQPLPLDANPAYESFRRQADANYFSKTFSLGPARFGDGKVPAGTPEAEPDSTATSSSFAMPYSPTRTTQDSCQASNSSKGTDPASRPHSSWRCGEHDISRAASSQTGVEAEVNSLHDSAYVSCDSKRNSTTSVDPPLFPNTTQSESPAQMDALTEPKISMSHLRTSDFVHPRFPVALGHFSMTAPKTDTIDGGFAPLRAETAPAKISSAQGIIDVGQLREIIDRNAAAVSSGRTPLLLLLDVRVATYYTTSRIRGALNMCIPTTLLKRATFNLEKMQLTFAKDEDQAKFSAWRDATYLVVYDNSSAEMRDAIGATNMLRKFTNEGYKGEACILRGGFKAFSEAYPDLLDCGFSAASASGPSALSLNEARSRRLPIAPIIGGVMLPSDSNCAVPFFSNIRQNMDLADGVGRIELSLPPRIAVASLPTWLKEAADPNDHGQKVSEKFLKIELAEQMRMKNIYGAFNPAIRGAGPSPKIQICGVEKGSKNRYKDILPFEHARVRLQNRASDDCDYVNASHLRASRSNKRYIASQAPLPATFADFWSMIWDEDIRVIVMLTAESEGGQLKCHPYWKSNEYGAVKVRMLSEKRVSLDVEKYWSDSSTPGSITSTADSEFAASHPSPFETGRRRAHTTVSVEGDNSRATSNRLLPGQPNSPKSDTPFVYVRKFALSHDNCPFSPIQEVTQLHYAMWPDFGAPAQPSHLLALVELANVMQRAASPPDASKANATTFPVSRSSGSTGSGNLDQLVWPWHDEPESNVDPRPLLVHCSAGCGRTGTFCTVDSVVDMLKRQNQRSVRRANAAANLYWQDGRRQSGIAPSDPVDSNMDMADDELAQDTSRPGNQALDVDEGFDSEWLDNGNIDLIAKTVEDFRTQRLSMVQTLRQFVLCYETIAEWISMMQERRGGSMRGPGRARSESVRMRMTLD